MILGAGFDSRGIRQISINDNINVYEIDEPSTQNTKIEKLKQNKIHLPKHIHFISTDLTNKSWKDNLLKSGFSKNKKTLFILEGVLMYLDKQSVDNIFEYIKTCYKECQVIFDYVSKQANTNFKSSEKEIAQKLNEEWLWEIEKEDIKSFLINKSFKQVENFDAIELEKKYFKKHQSKPNISTRTRHGIALAEIIVPF